MAVSSSINLISGSYIVSVFVLGYAVSCQHLLYLIQGVLVIPTFECHCNTFVPLSSPIRIKWTIQFLSIFVYFMISGCLYNLYSSKFSLLLQADSEVFFFQNCSTVFSQFNLCSSLLNICQNRSSKTLVSLKLRISWKISRF